MIRIVLSQHNRAFSSPCKMDIFEGKINESCNQIISDWKILLTSNHFSDWKILLTSNHLRLKIKAEFFNHDWKILLTSDQPDIYIWIPRLGCELHPYGNRTPPVGFEPPDFDSWLSHTHSGWRALWIGQIFHWALNPGSSSGIEPKIFQIIDEHEVLHDDPRVWLMV